jgi:hypothetical protein
MPKETQVNYKINDVVSAPVVSPLGSAVYTDAVIRGEEGDFYKVELIEPPSICGKPGKIKKVRKSLIRTREEYEPLPLELRPTLTETTMGLIKNIVNREMRLRRNLELQEKDSQERRKLDRAIAILMRNKERIIRYN